MAGSNPAFDPEVFRQAIRSTMVMGLPPTESDRATFIWDRVTDFAVKDPKGRPYNWTASPTVEETHDEVQIACAVEFAARPAGSVDTTLGQFDISRAVITILDEDYEEIVGATHVKLGGNLYLIDFVAPPLGLFEVQVYQLYASAVDES